MKKRIPKKSTKGKKKSRVAQARQEDAHLDKQVQEAGTLAEMYGIASNDSLRRGLQKLPLSAEVKVKLLSTHRRLFQPWPNWVLRVMAEIFIVHYPKVRKQS